METAYQVYNTTRTLLGAARPAKRLEWPGAGQAGARHVHPGREPQRVAEHANADLRRLQSLGHATITRLSARNVRWKPTPRTQAAIAPALKVTLARQQR